MSGLSAVKEVLRATKKNFVDADRFHNRAFNTHYLANVAYALALTICFLNDCYRSQGIACLFGSSGGGRFAEVVCDMLGQARPALNRPGNRTDHSPLDYHRIDRRDTPAGITLQHYPWFTYVLATITMSASLGRFVAKYYLHNVPFVRQKLRRLVVYACYAYDVAFGLTWMTLLSLIVSAGSEPWIAYSFPGDVALRMIKAETLYLHAYFPEIVECSYDVVGPSGDVEHVSSICVSYKSTTYSFAVGVVCVGLLVQVAIGSLAVLEELACNSDKVIGPSEGETKDAFLAYCRWIGLDLGFLDSRAEKEYRLYAKILTRLSEEEGDVCEERVTALRRELSEENSEDRRPEELDRLICNRRTTKV